MDCIEGMKQLEDNSIDSIVTDPPYELGFMGKKWDSTGIAYNVNVWKEALRVLKPGGYLLAFGGTRTYHRMTCAIEDAGFEIRDCIQWIYGSGFPKSMDISKAIDKQAGAEREIIGVKKYASPAGNNDNFGVGNNTANPNKRILTAPSTPEAQQWEGWGTALKPANEPIVVARKPLSEKTVAENVLKWGTGGINIDGCRVETDELKNKTWNNGTQRVGEGGSPEGGQDFHYSNGVVQGNSIGRFPANVVFDEEAGEMLDKQSGISKSTMSRGGTEKKKGVFEGQKGSLNLKVCTPHIHSDSGGASRFFYCAKTSKSERGEGNNHPTVKPLKLIEYLCKLITPKNGTVLDPFIGSGTTAIACKRNNFNYIGIDNENTYCDISNKRIAENA